MNPRISNIGFVIACFVAVALLIAFVSRCQQLNQVKAQLVKSDKDIDAQVKALQKDTAMYAADARSFERLYAEDTSKLALLQQNFDSLGNHLTTIKAFTHAQLITINRLSDAATDSLYRANLIKYKRLIQNN